MIIWQLLAGAAALLFLGLLVLFRRRIGWLLDAPMVGWELRRLGRNKAFYWVRIGLALFMLIALFIAYMTSFPGSPYSNSEVDNIPLSQMARFGESYLIAFLVVETIAVVLLTPVLIAGGVSREKELGRLDFIRSTAMSHAEIVWGMYISRVANLLGNVALGLPILMLSILFGGVDVVMVLCGLAIISMTVFSLGAYVQWQSIRRPSTRESLVITYWNMTWTTAIGLCCGCAPLVSAMSPFSALLYSFYSRESRSLLFIGHVAAYLIIHLILTITWLRKAVRAMADPTGQYSRIPDSDIRVDLLDMRSYTEAELEDANRHSMVPMLRDDENIFLWKERYFSNRFSVHIHGAVFGCIVAAGLTLIFLILSVVFITTIDFIDKKGSSDSMPFREMVKVLMTVMMPLFILAVILRSSTAIVRERERDTLPSLMLLPTDRVEILMAKWWHSLYSLRWFFLIPLALMLMGVLLQAVSVVGFTICLVRYVSVMVLANTFALAVSLSSKTTTSAMIWCLVVSITWQLLTFAGLPFDSGRGWISALLHQLSPAISMWEACQLGSRAEYSLPVAVLLAVGELMLAGVLWRWLSRRFENEGRA
ncbi:MAG: ABC transporter permease subunit [Fimbriiglobus sp.]